MILVQNLAFPPGAATDLVGRVIATRFSEMSGQRMIAENRPGVTGSIGLDSRSKNRGQAQSREQH